MVLLLEVKRQLNEEGKEERYSVTALTPELQKIDLPLDEAKSDTIEIHSEIE
jgi:hypothetical protein